MSLLSPQLQAFIAIAKCKTVHGAADVVHLTQTAVTQRIRTLEAKLKTSLFTRTRRGMLLTPEGEALLRYCHAVHEIEGEALAQIKGAGVETEIQMAISGPTSIMHSRIMPQCFPLLKKFPHLLLQFDINDVESGAKKLRNGFVQLAVVPREEVAPEMMSKLLKSERYVLVCSKQWKNRKLHDIIQHERIVDFDHSDQLTYQYLKHFNLLESARHDRHFANRTEGLAMMLMAGLGYGLLTTEFSKPYLDKGQLIMLNGGKMYENVMALAWYTRPEPPQYFSALINAIN